MLTYADEIRAGYYAPDDDPTDEAAEAARGDHARGLYAPGIGPADWYRAAYDAAYAECEEAACVVA